MSEVQYYLCPECGADVPVGSRGCQACQPQKVTQAIREKKERKTQPKKTQPKKTHSWEQDSAYDGLDLPDEDSGYEDFVAREFGDKPHQRVGLAWYWWLTAVVLLALMAGFLLRF